MSVYCCKENQGGMNWNRLLDETSPITPLFLTKEAYDKHRTQQEFFSIQKSDREYDSSCLGLYCTTVGYDEQKNDFWSILIGSEARLPRKEG